MHETIERLIGSIVAEELSAYQKQIIEAFRGFSLKRFKEFDSNLEMLGYAKEYLPILGKGSNRTTFALGAGKVLKVRNSNTYRQNEKEVEAYTNPLLQPYLAKIYDFDGEDYRWLVVEGVQVIADNAHLKKKFSVNDTLLIWFYDAAVTKASSLDEALEMAIVKQNDLAEEGYYKREPSLNKKFNSDDLTKFDLELLQKIYELSELGIDDIDRLDHWGITTNGRLVLVDAGLVRGF